MRWILLQGMPTRLHDESENYLLNMCNILGFFKYTLKNIPDVQKVVLENAPGNFLMLAPLIQKDIINVCAKETTKAIIEELGDGIFSILVDVCADLCDKDQMTLFLRYISKKGEIIERFLGIVYVPDTNSLTLKATTESLLMEHSLSLSRVRGQCYNGAGKMQDAIHDIKTLIMRESPSAYYVHCFSHQLQLTLAVVAKKNADCNWLFVDVLTTLVNYVDGSPERK
ncbi:uncharacterized protein [Spinacia oleracea]|uniref:DUF4371 domain-containing protein n=1 Tax=Spinacia oleracea TaxID=3562 RepID=A0A9R0HS12_SPIOL|nr:uncharacterized protein LOC110775077 [Spinacia oleracea]